MRDTIFQRRSRVLNLLLSSLIAGTVGTLVILAIYFLFPYYRGVFAELLSVLGSPFTRGGSRFVGVVVFLLGGIIFAALYGWAALALAQTGIAGPVEGTGQGLFPNLVLLGIPLGFVHSIPMGFLFFIVMNRYRADDVERNRFMHIPIHIASHIAFGVTVMFLHSRFLQV